MSNKIETINKIKKFLDGHNQEVKYLVNVEANSYNNYAECFIHNKNGDKTREQIYYKPFIYMKDLKKHGRVLYGGEKKHILKNKLHQYGVSIKKLRTDNQKRLVDGFCYKVTSTQSLNSIIGFFKDGGIDPYLKEKDEDGNTIMRGDMPYMPNKDLFFILKPAEQFFISTGIRLYRGYDEYNKLHKVIFDIETTGLRYETTRMFAIGVRDNRGFEKILEVDQTDDDESERKLIKDFFKTVIDLKPAIVGGYNSEDFDFNFILGRAKKLELDIEKEVTTLNEKLPIKRTFGNLKYGNTSEKYTATKMWGISVIDIQHAAKKTAAINSDITNTKLKYICKFEGIAKPNRTYIKGDDGGIGKMYYENKTYVADEFNDYIEIPDKYQELAKKLHKIQWNKNKNKITEQQAVELREKQLRNDEQGKDFVRWYKENNTDKQRSKFITGRALLREYLKDDLWETAQVDELYNQSSFLLAKMIPTTYDRITTMGTAAMWELLLTTWSYENNLAIPDSDVKEDFPGGLSRCFKTGLAEDIIKIDFNSLYPFIQLTYDVFPMFDIMGAMKMILTYSTTTRDIYKKIGNEISLNKDELDLLKNIDSEIYEKYNAENLVDKDINMSKVKQSPIKTLNNSLFGALGSDMSFKWSDNRSASRITCLGRLQLRHAAHWFNGFGCIPLLAVTDGVNFQIPKKTNIKVDNVSVEKVDWEGTPEEMWKYNNKTGINALIDKFNEEEMIPPYMGVSNDGTAVSVLNLYRINYAMLTPKKDKKTGETILKVKLTGNTIKSKTMPEYIEDFIDNGLELILRGKGKEFIDYYYNYAEDIFYHRIPLKKIASKSKIKTNIKGYLNRGTDKNGKPKAMQAHMELIIDDRLKTAKEIFKERGEDLIKKIIKQDKDVNNNDWNTTKIKGYNYHELMLFAEDDEEFFEKITPTKEKRIKKLITDIVSDYMPPEPELDNTIYYVNTGYRKSHGDVQLLKDKETGKMRKGSKLIYAADLQDNPNMLGYYNKDKYLEAFNKRVEKFLVGFKEEVREKIPAKIKRSKKKNEFGVSVEHEELVKNVFTEEELELGMFDWDSLDDSLYLEPKELKFWNDYGYNPFKIWDGFNYNENDFTYDEYEEILEYLNKKMKEDGKPPIKAVDDKLEPKDMVLIKDRNDYHIAGFNGYTTKIIKYNIDIPKTKRKTQEEEVEKKQDEERKKLVEETSNDLNDERYFKAFKRRFNISGELDGLSMNEFFMVMKEAKKPFDLFVGEMKEKELEDYDNG